MARATVGMRQARDLIFTQRKEQAKVARWEPSLKSPKVNVASYETSEEELKNRLVAAINDSVRLIQLVRDIRAEVADLQEQLGAEQALFGQSLKIHVRCSGRFSDPQFRISVRA